MKTHLTSLCLISLGLIGCTDAGMSRVQSSYEMEGRADVIQYSLFKEDREIAGDEVIEKALNGKIEYAPNGKMAVVQIGRCGIADIGNSDKLLSALQKQFVGNPYVGDVIKIPQILMPERVTIPVIRGIVSRLQCHTVLLYNVSSKTDYTVNIIDKNKTRVIMTVEGLVIHVKTGIIPVTEIVDRIIDIEQKDGDKNRYEAMQNAEKDALESALIELGKKISVKIK